MLIAQTAFLIKSMRRSSLHAALTLCVFGIPATAASERFEQWSLEQPGDFIFALSFKRSISFDDRTATSEFASVCNQEEKYVAVLQIPLDGTFKNRQNPIPIMIQKIGEQSDASDLMQSWENAGLHIFGIARQAGGTCLVPKGQRSRGIEIGSLLFPQRSGCEYANHQSHGH
jgi:hypothetical protein